MLSMNCPAVFPSGLISSDTRTTQALLFESCNREAAFFFQVHMLCTQKRHARSQSPFTLLGENGDCAVLVDFWL